MISVISFRRLQATKKTDEKQTSKYAESATTWTEKYSGKRKSDRKLISSGPCIENSNFSEYLKTSISAKKKKNG